MGKLDSIFSLLAIIAGLAIMVISITTRIDDNRIKHRGAKASATVVDIVVTNNKPRNRAYDALKDKTVWGIYQFKAKNGSTYKVQATTSGAHIGKKTTIYYNPNRPGQEYYLDSDAYGFYLGSGISLVIISFGIIMFRRASGKSKKTTS
jgi:hypothetical protein